MKLKGKYWLWIVLAGVLATAGFFVYRYERRPLTITGAVTIEDADFRKQLPIADAEVFVDNGLAAAPVRSNSSGFFSLRLFKKVRRGQPITLRFRHPGYQPLDLKDTAADKLYIAQMVPIRLNTKAAANKPVVIIGNVRVRYSIKALRSMNVGSAVKTFAIENKANVPCDDGPICSPDGKWRAAIGSVSLDAGLGQEFHNARLSCIAGPCPFTRVESDNFFTGGQTITASVRNWSDTAMYLLEAEVAHSMVSQIDHQSYPVIFGPTLNFTLPAEAEGVSLEGDLGGETIIFPLGPNLLLSWADCTVATNPDQTKVYRCELKPGYQLQP
ncbi:MAG TPA: carboxypeptidase-like regulatory domain-containing protein [Candidatus Sulfotelmatobacter sp.]|jgi:hypothetical protein|nr:carboxypeptidase-like regulatory domain-containing protein [Candidatus Sulfotelmatobacter sp.]